MMYMPSICNKFIRDRKVERERKCTRQNNHCVSFLGKLQGQCFSNIDEKKVTGINLFWKMRKSFFLISSYHKKSHLSTMRK